MTEGNEHYQKLMQLAEPTDKQIAFLRKLGVSDYPNTKCKATFMIYSKLKELKKLKAKNYEYVAEPDDDKAFFDNI